MTKMKYQSIFSYQDLNIEFIQDEILIIIMMKDGLVPLIEP